MRARDLLISNLVLMAMVVACGGDAGVAHRMCERLDECNALGAGTSVDECAESVEHQLDELSSAERSDTEKLVGDCLEFETCTLLLSCLDPGSPGSPPADPPPGSPPPNDPPPQGTGQFHFEWSIELDGAASTCAAVGATKVHLASTGSAGAFLDIFDCAALQGTTGRIPSGAYSLVVSIHDAGGAELGATDPFSVSLGAGQVADLGGLTWQFQ